MVIHTKFEFHPNFWAIENDNDTDYMLALMESLKSYFGLDDSNFYLLQCGPTMNAYVNAPYEDRRKMWQFIDGFKPRWKKLKNRS